jgi:glycine cleavage system H protein
MANIPQDLKYSEEHEYVRTDGDTATIGITDYAQGELGDVVFVELPKVGDTITRGESFGTIEAVKAVSELYAPLDGEVTEVNDALDADPAAVNNDPNGEGWMIRVRMADPSQIDQLLDAEGYQSHTGG